KVVIVSKRDINITGWVGGMTGALIAPNGSVTINHGNFTGIIISGKGFKQTGGGGTINMLEMSDLFTEDTLPIIVYEENGSDNGNGGTGDNGSGNEGNQKSKLEIIEPIREI
ncbi:MAG: hypothetical protein M0P14_08015, partial [Alkaliphilus sp.]|nr:hypothetical protein [Alkaliphilus sp.]